MHVLMLGLYAEGRTDERFLPILIRRTTEYMLIQYDRSNIEANEPEIIRINKDRRHMSKADCIRLAAIKAHGYHALIVHSDADDLTYEQAYPEALQKVLKAQVDFNFLQARNVGSYSDPKDAIEQLIRASYPRYPRLWTRIRGELYEQLAPKIRLECLQQVPAYNEFESELKRTLKALNLIQ
jgi:hypothetical protein